MVAPLIAAAGGIAGPLFDLVDKLFTSDDERADAKRRLVELEQKGELAQIAVNMQEAQHESIFVAGWRPAVGWVCVAAFAYAFVLQPFAGFVATVAGVEPEVLATLPDLDISDMMPVLLGMLGLGGLRTYEKRTGANKNR